MQHLTKLFVAGLELTLACSCRCETCASGAGKARPDELSTEEWVGVIRDLADLGCRRIALLGGEPLLRRDWALLAQEAIQLGLRVEMITSGIDIDPNLAAVICGLGLASVTVSVDGVRAVHDRQRGVAGGYDRALAAIAALDRSGMRVGVTTQINKETLPTLDELAAELQAAGAMGWQLQLTIPCGRAQVNSAVAVDPEMMPDLYRAIRRLSKRRGLRPYVTDNIGYLTPDDPLLRTPPGSPTVCWLGCFAGLRNIGILSNGSVKGCLALPDSMIEGNIRELPLKHIWNDPRRFAYNRAFDLASLGGDCADCDYGSICRGGCIATAMAVHKRPGMSTHCLRLQGGV